MNSTMNKVSLRNLAAHKLRLALTVLAVVLGTSFLSGALMFTNMLSSTFDSAVDTVLDDVDAVVRPAEGESALDKETVDGIRANGDVDRVNLMADESVVIATDNEVAVQTRLGSSRLGVYYEPQDTVGRTVEVVEGHAPKEIGDAVINANGAHEYGLHVGQELIVVDRDGRNTVRITGLIDDPLVQATSLRLGVTEETYLDYYSYDERFPAITVGAKEGVGAAEVVDNLRSEFPGLKIEAGEKVAQETTEQIRDALSFVTYFLVAFGLVGLLVGTFLIANTFSMIVAQRTKEFALLRALGASRGQITRSVALEAALVGLLGSVLGVVAGAGLVLVIRAGMNTFGMPLPQSGIGLSVDAVVVPLVVGTVVTVLSALAPARKAGKVRPVEAMRASEAATPQPLMWRTIAGAVLVVVAVVAAGYAMAWDDGATRHRAILVGVAALSVISGLFLAGPALSLPVVPPLGRVIGAPFGEVGRLASTNTRRNPRRTATTAFALMLGIALVTMIGMLGASMKQSVDDVAASEVNADYVLMGPEMGSFPVPGDLPDRLAEVDGVGNIASYTQAPITVDGEFGHQFGPVGMTDVLRGDPSDLIDLNVVDGDVSLTGDSLIAPEHIAQERGWKVGDTVEVAAPTAPGKTVDVTVAGLFSGSNVLQMFVVSDSAAAKVSSISNTRLLMVGVDSDGSTDLETLRARLEDEVRGDIVVQVRSAEEMSGEVTALIDQMLFILYALLSLAVVVAVLGIVNTLTLSVIERRQEIGMLRAVGSQRRQIRTMILLESVQMTVYGAVLGVLLGLGLGWAFLTVLENQGLTTIAVPTGLIATVLAASVVVGLLAAVWPGQRAAKTPPLDAIAE